MLGCIPWRPRTGSRGKGKKPAQLPAPPVLEQLPLCAECRSRGVLAALQGARLPASAGAVTVKKGSTSRYLKFPSLAAAGERQGTCVVCRFVLSMIPEARRRGFGRWPCNKGYDLWITSGSAPPSPRPGSSDEAAIALRAGFRLGLPSLGTGAHIKLLEGPEPTERKVPSGRYQAALAAKMRGQIRFDHVKTFLKVCEEQHPECHVTWPTPATNIASETPSPWQLLLVDTSDNCLVSSSLSARYVALSYVWGGVEQLQCTRSGLSQLMETDGLLKHWNEIPKTITDGIELVKSIDERYLWVDTLCIVQDDLNDKALQIARMGRIFSAAVLTICAVGGQDAHAGLPGTFPGTRPLGCYSLSPTMALVADPGRSGSHIQHSEYESRGWTLQERALARRCLYVMDAMVLVSCLRWYADEHEHHINWIRDRDKEELEEDIGLLHAMTDFSPLYPLNRAIRWSRDTVVETACAYNRLVELYTKRRLTFQKDIVHAFTGIASRMEEFVPGRSLCAMPSGLLHFALLWTMANEDHASDEKPKLERNEDFPSWTWAGYVGHIAYDNANVLLDLLAYDEKYTLQVEFGLVLPSSDPGNRPRSPSSAAKAEAEAKPEPCPLPSASPYSASSITPPRPLPQILHLHTLVVDTWCFTFSEYTCPEPEREGQPWRWYFYSQGTAWRANIHEKAGGPERGRLCGMLLDGPANLNILEGNARASRRVEYAHYSFILLSRTRTPSQRDFRRNSYLEVSRPESQGGNGWVNPKLELHSEALKWYARSRPDRHKAEILSVLVVGWRKQEYAERVGIAFIAAEAWERASPVRKCVRIV